MFRSILTILTSSRARLCVISRIVFIYRPVVTICTAKWSLYVSTAQWSVNVPHSSHYMYRTVVTICTAQWSLYVPHSGHYMYRTVVTIRTTSLTYTILRSAHTLYLYVLCGSQNKQPLFLERTTTKESL
jgi:hypothetical protein